MGAIRAIKLRPTLDHSLGDYLLDQKIESVEGAVLFQHDVAGGGDGHAQLGHEPGRRVGGDGGF